MPFTSSVSISVYTACRRYEFDANLGAFRLSPEDDSIFCVDSAPVCDSYEVIAPPARALGFLNGSYVLGKTQSPTFLASIVNGNGDTGTPTQVSGLHVTVHVCCACARGC